MEAIRKSPHTIKVTQETKRRLQLVSALTGERQFEILMRLIDNELYRVQHRMQDHLVLEPRKEGEKDENGLRGD